MYPQWQRELWKKQQKQKAYHGDEAQKKADNYTRGLHHGSLAMALLYDIERVLVLSCKCSVR